MSGTAADGVLGSGRHCHIVAADSVGGLWCSPSVRLYLCTVVLFQYHFNGGLFLSIVLNVCPSGVVCGGKIRTIIQYWLYYWQWFAVRRLLS